MTKKRIIRQLRGGQITIPKVFRDEMGIDEDSMLEATLDGDTLTLRQAEAVDYRRNGQILKELYDAFAPVRERLKDVPEEEINAAIDAAIAEVRAEERARKEAERRQAS